MGAHRTRPSGRKTSEGCVSITPPPEGKIRSERPMGGRRAPFPWSAGVASAIIAEMGAFRGGPCRWVLPTESVRRRTCGCFAGGPPSAVHLRSAPTREVRGAPRARAHEHIDDRAKSRNRGVDTPRLTLTACAHRLRTIYGRLARSRKIKGKTNKRALCKQVQ